MQCLKWGCTALNADTCCEAILKPYFLTIDPGEGGEGGGEGGCTWCKKLGKTDLLSRLTVEIRQSMSHHSTMLHMNLIPLTATKWRECGGSSIINSRSTCWLIVCSLLTEWVPALSSQGCWISHRSKAGEIQWWGGEEGGGGVEQCRFNFDRWALFFIHSVLYSISHKYPVS